MTSAVITSRTAVLLGIRCPGSGSVASSAQVVDRARQRIHEVAGDESSMPGEVRGASMQKRPDGRGIEGLETAGEQAADDPREDVAGAGRRQRGAPDGL